jgi:pSer/pThr/pTyr-binding forkhead associated (FHA) protein
MIQVRILSGKQAGTVTAARRFPFQAGRAPGSDLVLDEAGVWDRHFAIRLDPAQGFLLARQSDALVTVNGMPAQETLLHNGDSIEIGATRLQFWLGDTRQRGYRLREWLLWTGIAALNLVQIALIYRLLR